MNGYRELAQMYDRLMETDYEALADHLLSLFARHASVPRTLLDLACGSGRLTAALAARGKDMIGVDRSPDMLSYAQQQTGGQALLLCQDMCALDLRDTVDGAVCTMDSLNHLTKTAEIAAVLDRLRLFIAPGGLFIFDVNTPYKHRAVLGDNTFVFEQPDLMAVWQNRFLARTCEVQMTLDFFCAQADGTYVRTGDCVRERAYTLATWRRLLKAAQFDILAVYDGMTVSPPGALCERWTIVAENTRPAAEFV
ncbi:MAG: class I SAM-dependent DNA methyltransferase [Acutalibacteraceae bacterium]